jgi:DNA-binding transcriptional regulator PaaX
MSDLHITEQNVLRAFARQTGWTHLMDVITDLREVGYEPRKVVAGVRRLVARGLLRGSSAERLDYQLTDEGRKALAV